MDTPNLEGATVLTAEPSAGAYTNDIVTAAHALLSDLDITGVDFEPIPPDEVLPTPAAPDRGGASNQMGVFMTLRHADTHGGRR